MSEAVKAIKQNIKRLSANLAVATNIKLKKAVKKWDQQKACLKDPYTLWLKYEQGHDEHQSLGDLVKANPMEKLPDNWEYVAVVAGDVVPAEDLAGIVNHEVDRRVPHEYEMPGLIYGDDDILLELEDGSYRRVAPDFKPDYSPETLLQVPYMGSFILIRRDVFEAFASESVFNMLTGCICAVDLASLYELMLTVSDALFKEKGAESILHIPMVLSHRYIKQAEGQSIAEVLELNGKYPEAPEFADIRRRARAATGHINLVGLRSKFGVSVVIPSKDHPEVLRTCVSSLRKLTKSFSLEIIVIDNGSAPEAKEEYEALSQEFDFQYIYYPMDFNYSKMNNIGIEKAGCDLVLLLNDDTEIIDENWLANMASYAMHPEIGAVGAKLLYAGTNKLQHVGVTNLPVGPSHKLIGIEDEGVISYGKNIYDMNVLAVTGACLLAEKKKLLEVQGLNEDLSVAYNDIDLCLKLYEKGYRNVQCNGAVLYHYESLTRGADTKGSEKWARLTREREALYELHPWARGYDPYYNVNLVENSVMYVPSIKNLDSFYSAVDASSGEEMPFNESILYGIDRVVKDSAGDYIWCEGWAFMSGADNRRYTPEIILEGSASEEWESQALTLVPERTLREDVVSFFGDEQNIDLSGFCFKVPMDVIGNGTWKVGVGLSDVTGKNSGLKYTDVVLSQDMENIENG